MLKLFYSLEYYCYSTLSWTELKTLELDTLNPDRLILISTVETFNFLFNPLLLQISHFLQLVIHLITNTDTMLYHYWTNIRYELESGRSSQAGVEQNHENSPVLLKVIFIETFLRTQKNPRHQTKPFSELRLVNKKSKRKVKQIKIL